MDGEFTNGKQEKFTKDTLKMAIKLMIVKKIMWIKYTKENLLSNSKENNPQWTFQRSLLFEED